MSAKFIIKGGKPLVGTVEVRGSKNAALPIIAATLLTKEKCRISNLPLVLDVYRMIEMLEQMGSKIRWSGKRSVEIENNEIIPSQLRNDAVKKMRASILLLGPLLARFGKVENMQYPGGCSIGSRPIDTHLKAFEDLGAKISAGKNTFSVEVKNRLKSAHPIVLNEFSVTATENLLMFLSLIPTKIQIRIAAAEPHVQDLARFLSHMGSNIRGAGTSDIVLHGKSKLRGVSHKVIPDYIEAGTFILALLSTGGKMTIKKAPVLDLDLFLKKLETFGADIKIFPDKNLIKVCCLSPGMGRTGKRMRIDKVQTLPHPGIPTDLQPAFSMLATQTSGDTLIHEPLYEKRLESLKELCKMGAKIKIYDPHRALVSGPTGLYGAEVISWDLRGGASLVVAGLAAHGTTVVHNAEHVERGYENFAERLKALGADIIKA